MSENLDLTKKEVNDLPKPANEAEAKPASTVLPSSKPEPKYWQYMGTDSTAVIDIAIVSVGDKQKRKEKEKDKHSDNDEKSVAAWINHPPQKISSEKMIQDGINLVKSISAEANQLINEANKYFADRAISIGVICHKLKELIRGDKRPWAVWAEENLPFIAKRNREKYMLLASRPDCWPVSFLGVDRLEVLCSVTREMEGTDQIGDLFKKYKIHFDEKSEINMGEFKALIDAAINNERLTKNGLTFNIDKVANATNTGVDFDKSFIKRLKDVRDCGGNPETLLDKILLTGGKEEMDVTPEKRLQDFNHLSNRLIKTLDFIMVDQDQLVKIDRDTFAMLMAKLTSIQEMGILKEDVKKAA